MNETELERLVVRIVGDSKGYESMAKNVQKTTDQVSGHVQFATQRIHAFGMSIRGFGAEAASLVFPLVGAFSAVSAGLKGINLAAEAEQNELSFGTMLQSAEKGKQMVADLQKFAAETPLNTADVQHATKTLLQFGLTGEEVIPTLRQLGDATGGDAQRFQQMALAFGQMSSSGRLMGQDLLQMINAGFNPLQEISRTTGESVASLKAKMEQGAISVDMVKDAFRSATSEGGSFFNLMQKQSQSVSGLWSTMQDDIDSALREIGKSIIENLNLKGLMKDVSALAQRFTDWFNDLDAGTKQAGFAIIGATVAFVALTAAIVAAGAAFNIAFGGVGYIAGVIITVVGAIVTIITAMIVSVGGVSAAWDKVKGAAIAAWDWLAPVRAAIGSFFSTLWDLALETWGTVRDFIVEVWDDITSKTGLSMEDVRIAILKAIVFAEFTIRNFGDVWAMVWAFAKFKFIEAMEEYKYQFQVVAPAIGKYFLDNWRSIIGNLWQIWTNLNTNMSVMWTNLLKYMFTLFSDNWDSMKKVIKGMLEGDFTQVFKVDWKANAPDLTKGMVDMLKGVEKLPEFKELPARVRSELEERWKAEFETSRDKVGGNFDAFFKQKMEEFNKSAGIKLGGEAVGETIGKNMMGGMGKELKKFDSVALRSSQALSNLSDYQAMLSGGKPQDKTVGLLTDIRNDIRDMARKPGVDLMPAGLA